MNNVGGKVHFVFLPDARRVSHFPVNGKGRSVSAQELASTYSGRLVAGQSRLRDDGKCSSSLLRDAMFKHFVQTLETKGTQLTTGSYMGPTGLPRNAAV